MNNRHNFSLLMRLMSLITAGIVISVIFLTNVDTYSWFVTSSIGSVSATSAETEDIVDTVELICESVDSETDMYINPSAIKIRKAPAFAREPLIFFSVEGEAAEYILNINPVRLDCDAYYIIPIDTDINIDQHAKLYNRSSRVDGHIRIKYMNEYIDVDKEISFTPKFLIDKLMLEVIRGEVQKVEETPRASMMRFSTLVEAPERVAYSVRVAENRNENGTLKDITLNALASLAGLLDWNGINIITEDTAEAGTVSYTDNFRPSEDQEFMMNIVYPGLKEYVRELEEYIGNLRSELEAKKASLSALDQELASLRLQYDELLATNAELTEQINSLTAIQLPIVPPVQPPVQPPASTPVITVPDVIPPPSTGGGSGTGTGDAGAGDTGSGTGTGDAGTGDAGSGTGTGDAGAGDTGSGTGTGDAGAGDAGSGTGTGDAGTGDAGSGTGTGDAGTGDTGSGTGSGDADTGDTGSGTGSGDAGTGDTGSGTGSGDAGTGDTGSGTGSGDVGTGDAGSGTGSSDAGTGDTGSGTGSGNTGTGDTGSLPGE